MRSRREKYRLQMEKGCVRRTFAVNESANEAPAARQRPAHC